LFDESDPFHTSQNVQAEGLAFGSDAFKAVIGDGAQILLYDLQKGTDGVVIYESTDEGSFTFEKSSDETKLYIFD